MKEKIRWGIMGAGRIANKFAREVSRAEGAVLTAVGSRTAEKAREFGEKYGIARCHASYEELAGDPEVDIVYIATPHNFHCENMLMCFEQGKAVLCEKSFVLNAAEAETAINKAREKRLFAMEAMWTRFLPASRRLCSLLADGAIGDITNVFAFLGFDVGAGVDLGSRIVDRSLAGGALLDVGIYVTEYATMLIGSKPDWVNASSLFFKPTGVDSQTNIQLGYGENTLASLSCSIRSSLMDNAVVCGTKGKIIVDGFIRGRSMTISTPNRTETLTFENRGEGFVDEIEECMNCMREGRLESSLMPLSETLDVMRIFDRAREIIGLRYPRED